MKDDLHFPGVSNLAFYWVQRAQFEEVYSNFEEVIHVYERASECRAQVSLHLIFVCFLNGIVQPPKDLVIGLKCFIQRIQQQYLMASQEVSMFLFSFQIEKRFFVADGIE